ncbi:MAG: molybdenum cofactor biosynthesis protein MoaE [Spirochaetes bacterium]|nr:MAG: molybdenum cofactor biosynthesis protein MoaE [Spirochaetota bacterium]
MKKILIQENPLDTAALIRTVGTKEDGAVLSFIGTARRGSMGKSVLYLHYEAYETMAMKELGRIADEACSRWPLSDCVIVHRTGEVGLGEPSVFIGVSTPHRAEGFQALQFIIDTIKKTVPIWKKEFFEDGSMWVSERP